MIAPDISGASDFSAMFVSARWGLIPRGEKDPLGGRQPINAPSETVATSYMFRFA